MKTLARLKQRRERHHASLKSLAVQSKFSGLQMWRELRRLERMTSDACEKYSNDSNYGLDRWEQDKEHARKELARIFGGMIPKGVYVNGDPRGHALKLDCDIVKIPDGMEKDWGGNGILAAEITED